MSQLDLKHQPQSRSKLSNGSLSSVVTFPIITAFFVLTVLNLFSLKQLHNSAGDIELIEYEIISSERMINDTLQTFKTQIQEWKNVLLRGENAEQRGKYWTRFQQREADVQAKIEQLLEVKSISEETALLLKEFRSQHLQMSQSYRHGFIQFKNADFRHQLADKAVQEIDRKPVKLLEQAAQQIRQHSSDNVSHILSVANNTLVYGVLLERVDLCGMKNERHED